MTALDLIYIGIVFICIFGSLCIGFQIGAYYRETHIDKENKNV